MKRSTLITAATVLGTGITLSVPLLAFAAGDQFVPLTQLPGLTSISTLSATSMTLPGFINNLYRISIGLAAFFAIVQITWAGLIFMSSADSISKNTKARGKIFNAVIGLVLVLAPFVVFSVINPSILNISLNFSSLQGTQGSTGVTAGSGTQSTTATCTPSCTNGQVCSNGNCVSAADAQNETACEAYSVIESDPGNTCAAGESPITNGSCCTAQPGFTCCGKK